MTDKMKTEVDELLSTLSRLRSSEYDTSIYHTGSRRVFKDGPEIKEKTDYDFMMMDTPANHSVLRKHGFHDKYGGGLIDLGQYGDSHSTAVYVKWNSDGDCLLPVEVVLKTPESFDKFVHFWDIMATNKNTFRELFWKSYTVEPELVSDKVPYAPVYPNTPDKIRERIDHWIRYVIPAFFNI